MVFETVLNKIHYLPYLLKVITHMHSVRCVDACAYEPVVGMCHVFSYQWNGVSIFIRDSC